MSVIYRRPDIPTVANIYHMPSQVHLAGVPTVDETYYK